MANRYWFCLFWLPLLAAGCQELHSTPAPEASCEALAGVENKPPTYWRLEATKTCQVDADCDVYMGVCSPDAANKVHLACAEFISKQRRMVTKCRPYGGDITQVTASCEAGICTANDPWSDPLNNSGREE